MSNKEDKRICDLCKHYDPDNCYCSLHGEFEIYEEDSCDDWEEDD